MMEVCKVTFVPKNDAWIADKPWYLVQTNNAQQAIETATARLMCDKPEHYQRYKPVCAFAEMF